LAQAQGQIWPGPDPLPLAPPRPGPEPARARALGLSMGRCDDLEPVIPVAPFDESSVVKALEVVATPELTIAEYFGSAATGDDRLSACVATISKSSGEAHQVPEYDEYIMVVSGEVQLIRCGAKVTVGQGEGVLLKAGESVTWVWPRPSQYVIICLTPLYLDGGPVGRGFQQPGATGKSETASQTSHTDEAWIGADCSSLASVNGAGEENAGEPYVSFNKGKKSVNSCTPTEESPSSKTPSRADAQELETATTEADARPTPTTPSGEWIPNINPANFPTYMPACGEMGRASSLSCFDQMLNNEGLMELRSKMDKMDQVEERPVRYGARHLSTPVVVVASEINPWSKTGGLAMVAGSFAYEFAVRGHRTMAIAPRYGDYKDCHRVGATKVWLDGKFHDVEYYHQRQEYGAGKGCDYVFVDHHTFHRPAGLYGDPAKGGEYEDNLFRFALLSVAAAEAPLVLELGGSVYGQEVCFIVNDWQTGLVPVYLLYKYKRNKTYQKARSIMVLHNMGYQGKYRRNKHPVDGFLGLPSEAERELQGEDVNLGADCLNLLSAGIRLADRVLTVSPNYAQEIQTAMGGLGLHNLLKEKANMSRLTGILNGISDEWNPMMDPNITQNYGPNNFVDGKAKCKAALQRRLGLRQDPSVALLGFCGRLCYQKGVHLIAEIIPWLTQDTGNGVTGRVQLVLMGKGDANYEVQLRAAEASNKGNVCGYVGFDPQVEHEMMAGCDLLLMPSQYEPCGLPQMYAQQYATLPVVHETGGLKDSVKGLTDDVRDREVATGFLFQGFHVNQLKERLYKALEVFHKNKELFLKMQVNAINSNYYWPQAIDEYEKEIDRTMEANTTC